MPDDPRKRGADIEIYEETDGAQPVTRPRFIRINGVDIGYTSLSGIEIEANSSTGLSVTLTLRPRSLTIHQVPPEPVTLNGHEAIKDAVKKGTKYIRMFYGDGHHNHSHTNHD